jgi:hypothetical protein
MIGKYRTRQPLSLRATHAGVCAQSRKGGTYAEVFSRVSSFRQWRWLALAGYVDMMSFMHLKRYAVYIPAQSQYT